MHVYAHVNTCDHGALGTGGMERAVHAATGMAGHTVAGGGRGQGGKCVCAVSMCEHVHVTRC